MGTIRTNGPIYYERILAAVIDFLVLSGLSISAIRELTDAALTKAQVKELRSPGYHKSPIGIESVPASVLNRWHRDRALLDSEANPISLRLYGEGRSLESLVREEKPQTSARGIVGAMKKLGLIREKSRHRYVPTSRVATIATLHPVLIEHVAHSLLRLLETVERNVSATNKKQGLIERFTHITDLPIREIPAFTSFSQEHGSAFLASVEDWLDSRRGAGKPRQQCSAGIHMIAYVEQQKF